MKIPMMLATFCFLMLGEAARAAVPMVMLHAATRQMAHPLEAVKLDLQSLPELRTDGSISWFKLVSHELMSTGGPVMALRAPDAIALQPLGEKRFGWIPTDGTTPAAIVNIPATAVSKVWDHMTEGVTSGDYSKLHATLREIYDGAVKR